MSYILLAALKTDGAGLVKEPDGHVYLYKPPYTLYQKRYISEEEYALGTVNYGFTELNETYRTIGEVINRLKEITKIERQKVGDFRENASNNDYLAYLQNIPAVLLPMMIEKQKEYFNNKRYQAVLAMSKGLLANPRLSTEQSSVLNLLLEEANQGLQSKLTEKYSIFNLSQSDFQKAQEFKPSLSLQAA